MPYTPNAVHFDDSNDYLSVGAGLTDAADDTKFTFSVWFKLDADGGTEYFLSAVNFFPLVAIQKTNGDRIRIRARNAAFTEILDVLSTDDNLKAADGWVHLLCSFDLSDTGKRHLYLSDVADLNTIQDYTNDSIDFTVNNWQIGAASGTFLFGGDMADLWFFPGVYLDLSVEANRRLFIDGNGLPVDLGSDGSTPTGSAPLVFLSGATASWHTNDGTGGGFTENGALTDADTYPGQGVAAGSAAGAATVSGVGTAIKTGAATVTAGGSVDGMTAAIRTAVAAVSGVGAVAAIGDEPETGAGVTAGVGAVAGVGASSALAVASVAGVCAVSVIASGGTDGAVAGVGAVSGVLSAAAQMAGAAAGVATVSGVAFAQSKWTLVGESGITLATAAQEDVALPGPPAEGDIVVIGLVSDSSLAGNNDGVKESGYTNLYYPDSNVPGAQAAYKIMGSTPDTTIDLRADSNGPMAGVIQVWRGVNSEDAIDASPTIASGATGNPNSPALTTINPFALAFAIGFLDDDQITDGVAPAGFGNFLHQEVGTPGAGGTVYIASRQSADPETINPAEFGGSGNDEWHAITFSLQYLGSVAAASAGVATVAGVGRVTRGPFIRLTGNHRTSIPLTGRLYVPVTGNRVA